MPEEIIIPDNRLYMKFTLLTLSEYIKFNNEISLVKGYALGDNTERCYPINPQQAKVNIQYDDDGVELSYDLMCVAVISGDVRREYPELIETFTLIDKGEINFADVTLTELITAGQNTTELDWELNHANATNVTVDLIQSDTSRSVVSNTAVDALVENETTIITVDDGN